MKVALFDFDGTLYPYETFNILLEQLKTHPKYKGNYKKFVRYFAPYYFGYKIKIVKKAKMQQKALEYYLKSFKDNSRSEIEQFFSDVAKDMTGDLRLSLINRIKQLQADHYYIMLVSGAFVPLLESIFKGLNIDCIIGSKVNFKGDRLDVESPFERIFADRKVEIIKNHFKEEEVDWSGSYAYSDSITDLKMLELVGKPVAVKPDSELFNVASAKDWRIHTVD